MDDFDVIKEINGQEKEKEESIPNELIVLRMAKTQAVFKGLYISILAGIIITWIEAFFTKTQISLTAFCTVLFILFALSALIAEKFKKCIFLYITFAAFLCLTILLFLQGQFLGLLWYLPYTFLILLAVFTLKNKNTKKYEKFLNVYSCIISCVCILVLVGFYLYDEWLIIKQDFWQFINPFCYLWTLVLMFKNLINFVILFIFVCHCILINVLQKLENFDNLKSIWEQTSGQKYEE
ncbi:MAG: hypothetical protein LUH05_04070 [Candidatus Gastranaerophilales bacterium]|nr:hypothetical protein [Candidatus Gastranaerophilales bacterium]